MTVMKSHKLVYLLVVVLCISFLPVPSFHAQEGGKGNITFQANNVPFLSIHFVEEFFRFQWDEVPWRHRAEPSPTFRELDVKLVIVCTTDKGVKHFSLRDFWRDVLKGTGAKRNDVLNPVTDCLYEFGFNVTSIPQLIADDVEYVYWKLEGANFDFSKVELEEIELFEQEHNVTRIHLPSNLVLSYEDLWKYGYTVKHPNKTVTIVEGVKGKIDWNLDPLVYSSNIITVTGYSEGSECGFNDLWLADKAGEFVLQNRDGITSTDGANVAVDYPLRPADEKVLGGANIEDLYLNITNWVNMTSTTILVVGTNREGISQVEYIAITNSSYYLNNGIFGTTKYYKTVTHTRVTAFSGVDGSYDYDMSQGQWGVVWKTGDTQFTFDCKIVIGNGTLAGTTWFADTSKQVHFSATAFTANWQTAMSVRRYAYVTMGTLVDLATKTTDDGCHFSVTLSPTWWSCNFFSTGADYNTANRHLYLYSCSFMGMGNPILNLRGGANRVWNALLFGMDISPNAYSSSTIDIFNTVGQSGGALQVYTAATMEQIMVAGRSYVFWTQTTGTFTISDAHARNNTRMGYLSTNWSGNASLGATGEVYRQYTFDLTVTTATNIPIENANVTLTYFGQGGGIHGSWLTDANGSIPQQTVTAGFYNQTGGDTIYDYNPYEIKITKDSYITYQRNFTQLEKKSWNIALLETTESHDLVAFTCAFVMALAAFAVLIVKKRKGNHAPEQDRDFP